MTWKLPSVDAVITDDAMVLDFRFVRDGDIPEQAIVAAMRPGMTTHSVHQEARAILAKILARVTDDLVRLATLKRLEVVLVQNRMSDKAASASPQGEASPKAQ